MHLRLKLKLALSPFYRTGILFATYSITIYISMTPVRAGNSSKGHESVRFATAFTRVLKLTLISPHNIENAPNLNCHVLCGHSTPLDKLLPRSARFQFWHRHRTGAVSSTFQDDGLASHHKGRIICLAGVVGKFNGSVFIFYAKRFIPEEYLMFSRSTVHGFCGKKIGELSHFLLCYSWGRQVSCPRFRIFFF